MKDTELPKYLLPNFSFWCKMVKDGNNKQNHQLFQKRRNTMSSGATIDFAAIEAEVSQLSAEQVKEQLVKLKARQIKQQKASYNPVKAKEWRDKKNAEFKAMVARAKADGSYEQIMADARAQAEQE